MKVRYCSKKAEEILNHMIDHSMTAGYVYGADIYFTYVKPSFRDQ